MMECFSQGKDILVHLIPLHLLALSEGKNIKVDILGQIQRLISENKSLTNYQSTKIMNEKADHLDYSALAGSLEDDMWIIDIGYSRHMTGDHFKLSSMKEKKTSHKVELGDKNNYPIKGVGQASIKLESGNNVHLSNVLYVPSLEKNLVSISFLE
jgi:hypothetical protein